jgi:hypothetical protein
MILLLRKLAERSGSTGAGVLGDLKFSWERGARAAAP